MLSTGQNTTCIKSCILALSGSCRWHGAAGKVPSAGTGGQRGVPRCCGGAARHTDETGRPSGSKSELQLQLEPLLTQSSVGSELPGTWVGQAALQPLQPAGRPRGTTARRLRGQQRGNFNAHTRNKCPARSPKGTGRPNFHGWAEQFAWGRRVPPRDLPLHPPPPGCPHL